MSRPNANNCCALCQHWRLIPEKAKHATENGRQGFCLRYPPVLDPKYDDDNITESELVWVQPITREVYWCGEFSPWPI